MYFCDQTVAQYGRDLPPEELGKPVGNDALLKKEARSARRSGTWYASHVRHTGDSSLLGSKDYSFSFLPHGYRACLLELHHTMCNSKAQPLLGALAHVWQRHHKSLVRGIRIFKLALYGPV
ncbi:hypothetical protein MAMT_01773 [Methylacidimicrobium tartarophylax]|uniref:Uncharacterized protein n=1 Tax=Methylacidimicrobium tartarophylax TaxID=1041768 RepID=A0A5E6MD86_9BACT|nr:hypothetical protein MAMT_01773 [Methylacidimicrobium tartarophylax]